MSVEEERLARATVSELTYSNMQRQLKRIFDEFVMVKSIDSVKVEPVYQTRQDDNLTSFNSRGRRNYDNGHIYQQIGRQEIANKFNYSRYNPSKRRNPLDMQGRPTKCHICESIFHWARYCPLRSICNF